MPREQHYAVAKSYLKDRALVAIEFAETEGRRLHGKNYVPMSWLELKRMLQDQFDNELASFNLSATFENRKQGENEMVEQYSHTMLELASRLGLREDETRKKVMAGLQQEIYNAVAMARPHTLQGLIQTAQLAENIVHRRATPSVKSIQALRTAGEATPSVPTQNVVTRALKPSSGLFPV